MAASKIHTLSLFTGIGGLDMGVKVALDWLGYRTRIICYVERDSYCQAILLDRMEEKTLGAAPICSDIADIPGKDLRGLVDLVIGGPPCQPVSQAGRGRGPGDNRWLWPAVLELVEGIQPRIVFFENVGGWLYKGHAADVVARLEALGYLVVPPLRLRASDVGSPQKERMRVFVMAFAMRPTRSPLARGVSQNETGDAGRTADAGHRVECGGEDVGEIMAFYNRAGREGIAQPDIGATAGQPAPRRGGVDRCDPELGRSSEPRHEGVAEARGKREQSGGGSHGLALYPPPDGPGAFAAWAEIFRAGRVDLAPTLPQSAVHQLANGSMCWSSAIRAVGNSCTPLQAAVAFVYQWNFLEIRKAK